MFTIGKIALPIAVLLPLAGGPDTDFTLAGRQKVLDAIRVDESGGEDPDSLIVGDDGKSLGPLQICHLYWQDALEFDPSIGGRYEDCRALRYAEKVVRAYMRRYIPEAWKETRAEVIARTHNGGPRGVKKRGTLEYWEKVRAVLATLD